MALYKESTKTKPILFFETFINNEALSAYEDMFYNYPHNQSQYPHKDKGYIIYTKDLYIDNEVEPIKEYFEEHLNLLLKSQKNTSVNYLEKRKVELEYQNIKNDIFIEKQLEKIQRLKTNIVKITTCKALVIEVLTILEKNIKEIGFIKQGLPAKLIQIKTNNPFFEPKIIRAKIIRLYDIAVEHRIIDDEEVLEETFINVFMSNNPESLEEKIAFKANNQFATYFLNCIIPLFEKLSHSQISKSKSFYNKGRKLLNQNDLDRAKNLYIKKIETQEYKNLHSDITKIFPKEK